MKLALPIVAIVASVLLLSTEAHTSSAYGNSIATASFRYTFHEHVRKAFIDSEQAREYMKRHDTEMKARFLTFQPKAEKAVKHSGLPIGEYDLFLPAIALEKDSDVTKIDKKAFPLNLVVKLGSEHADELIEVTVTKPITAAQLASFKSVMKSAIKVNGNIANEEELVAAAKFDVPIAATHIDEKFGLYVGTVTEVVPSSRAHVQAAMQAMLDKMLPKVREAFAAPDIASRMKLPQLLPVKPAVDRHPQGLPRAFHPWGPLAGGELVRMREDLGQVSAMIMIAPGEKYEWGDVHPVLGSILQNAGAAQDEHHKRIEAEADRLGRER